MPHSTVFGDGMPNPADPKWSLAIWSARCTVANPPGTPKPYSECQPFHYEFFPTDSATIADLQSKISTKLGRLLKKPSKISLARRPWQPSLQDWRQAA